MDIVPPKKTQRQLTIKDLEETPAPNAATPPTTSTPTAPTTSSSSLGTPSKSPKKAWYTFDWFKRLPVKKKLLIVVPVAVVLLGGGGATAFVLTRKKPAPPPPKAAAPVVQKVVEPPKPTTEASKLTGVQVDPALNKRGLTAVMIENSIDARPQSGLLDAGIVYEAIAEGGITRFMALFQEAQPDYIGPVRSARPYYITWLKPYGATYAHVGGSGPALQMIIDEHIRDMNEFVNANAYTRISSRYAPHNAYTSMAQLDAVRAAKNYDSPDFKGFDRKPEAPAKTPTTTSIDLAISSTYYNVHYDYDAATNSYKRSEGGKAHTDDRSGKQLAPKVVIAMIVPYAIDADGIHSDYQTIGNGTATVFQDGIGTSVHWSKKSIDDPLVFTDDKGASFKFNPGQTWITAIGQPSMLSTKGPAPATP